MGTDIFGKIATMQATINSAQRLAEMQEVFEEHAEYCARKDRAIFQTAENTENQIKLLDQQVKTLMENKKLLERQNEELLAQNKLLKDAYDSAKAEAEQNKKQGKKNKIFGWVSFAVSTLIAIGSLIVAIIAIIK